MPLKSVVSVLTLNSNSDCFFLFQILMDPMILSVLYVWCQLNKDMIVSFWFGTQFKVRQYDCKEQLFLTHLNL